MTLATLNNMIADHRGALPVASSLTHQHLLAVINTRIVKIASEHKIIRICDVGCGDGAFLSYIASCLPLLWPSNEFEFYGIDVDDSGVQASGFFSRTITKLERIHPFVDWTRRLYLISSEDNWPFEDGYLHVTTSNQVLEHVRNPLHFMSECYRTLSTGGLGVNLFPLKHYIWEGHLQLPIVHRIHQYDRIISYIKIMSRLGLGRFKGHKLSLGMSIDQYAEEHADYMCFMTNYHTGSEMLAICKSAQLRADYAYTGGYYTALLRKILRLPPVYQYGRPRFLRSYLAYWLYRYAASVTLSVEKRQTYVR